MHRNGSNTALPNIDACMTFMRSIFIETIPQCFRGWIAVVFADFDINKRICVCQFIDYRHLALDSIRS